MAVGNRAPTNTRGTTSYGGYELQLLAGGIVIASTNEDVGSRIAYEGTRTMRIGGASRSSGVTGGDQR